MSRNCHTQDDFTFLEFIIMAIHAMLENHVLEHCLSATLNLCFNKENEDIHL